MFLATNTLSSQVLNTLPEHICILNSVGKIIFVNKAWIDFERDNSKNKLTDWLGINYLDVCDTSAQNGSKLAKDVALGIRGVLHGEEAFYKAEYPCHSPSTQRWFSFNCLPFEFARRCYFLLQHADITQKVKADMNSNLDALTLVGNRRAFNEFLDREWRRCTRGGQPISAIIIDIDNFKQFNDTYGHVKGDHCLKDVSQVLKELVHRSSDIFCRYGGEEFVYILGNTNIRSTLQLCEKIHASIRSLHILHANSDSGKYLTVSIGTATVQPLISKNKEQLIELADNYLYQAKLEGKNTTRFHDCRREPCHPENCYQYIPEVTGVKFNKKPDD